MTPHATYATDAVDEAVATVATVVIDYGAGNLPSVTRALARAGFDPRVTDAPDRARNADLLVLPGQGHFGQVMRAFRASGFEPLVREHIATGKPFLGICVGLQLLLDGSDEAPEEPGLGVVPGRVRRFPAGIDPVPQMGWNTITKVGDPALLDGVPDGSYVYFANSYYAELAVDAGAAVGARTTYAGVEFQSAISIGTLHATQFHPEKSQAVGLRILSNLQTLASRGTA
ncbi:MAG: imidazole glycerol phosphate synthase subunit HisH [Trueperaceae bacterium]